MNRGSLLRIFICLIVSSLCLLYGARLPVVSEANLMAAPPPAKVERLRHVKVFYAVQREVEYAVETTGTLLAEADTDVSSEVDGIVGEIHLEEGQEVKAGDLLISLKDEEYRLKVGEAEARLQQATADRYFAEKLFGRMTKLYKDGVISVQEFNDNELKLRQAEAASEAAKATLALAQKNLKDTRILAPFQGIISKKNVDIGEYIKKGDTPLLNIVKIDPLKVEFSIPERYLSMVEEGEGVTVSVEAYPKEVFIGEIYYINPKIPPETRRFQCYARIDNTARKLKPGLFATLKVVVGKNSNIVIPEEAIISEEGVNYCFLVEGQRARKTLVRPGIKLKDGMLEILEGIKAGGLVVVRGQHVLLDGDKVEAERIKVAKEEEK